MLNALVEWRQFIKSTLNLLVEIGGNWKKNGKHVVHLRACIRKIHLRAHSSFGIHEPYPEHCILVRWPLPVHPWWRLDPRRRGTLAVAWELSLSYQSNPEKIDFDAVTAVLKKTVPAKRLCSRQPGQSRLVCRETTAKAPAPHRFLTLKNIYTLCKFVGGWLEEF